MLLGTLVGVATDDVIEVRNCFPVPHLEGTEVHFGKEYNRDMFALHKMVNSSEIIVGW